MHQIEIVFDKYVVSQVSEAQIKEIQIRGTSFSDKKCENCLNGYSSKGSDVCMICEIGSYLDTQNCIKCPNGFLSQPGSHSVTDCFKPEPCTENDYHYYFSDCSSGFMNVVYE